MNQGTDEPPRVSLHGFTGNRAAWDAVCPTIGLSLCGHAPEVGVPGEWTFADEVAAQASAIEAVVARAGQRVHLLGYSMGGRVALAIALEHPELIDRLTLVGVHPGIDSANERAARRQSDEVWCHMLESAGIAAFVAAWELLPLWHTQRGLPAEVLDRQRQARLAHDPAALAAALRALGTGAMPSIWSKLATLAMPTDLVAGALDDKYAALVQRMASLIPQSRVLLVEDAGHNPLLEAPDALRAAVWGEVDDTSDAHDAVDSDASEGGRNEPVAPPSVAPSRTSPTGGGAR